MPQIGAHGLSDMKVGAMQLPGIGGSEAGGPKEGADVAVWRNNRKTSVSGENEQGDVEGAGL